jgi:hypothetical protein
MVSVRKAITPRTIPAPPTNLEPTHALRSRASVAIPSSAIATQIHRQSFAAQLDVPGGFVTLTRPSRRLRLQWLAIEDCLAARSPTSDGITATFRRRRKQSRCEKNALPQYWSASERGCYRKSPETDIRGARSRALHQVKNAPLGFSRSEIRCLRIPCPFGE